MGMLVIGGKIISTMRGADGVLFTRRAIIMVVKLGLDDFLKEGRIESRCIVLSIVRSILVGVLVQVVLAAI